MLKRVKGLNGKKKVTAPVNIEEEEEVVQTTTRKRRPIKKEESVEEVINDEEEIIDDEEEDVSDPVEEEIEDEEPPKEIKRPTRKRKTTKKQKEEPVEEIIEEDEMTNDETENEVEESAPKTTNKKVKTSKNKEELSNETKEVVDNWLYTTKKPEERKASIKRNKPKYEQIGLKEILDRTLKSFEAELNSENTKDDDYKYVKTEPIEAITRIFEKEIMNATEDHSLRFLGGTIKPADRTGRVFRTKLADYDTYKGPHTVRTYNKEIGEPDKYKGSYDEESGVFTANGKWNYKTKKWVKTDKEIEVE